MLEFLGRKVVQCCMKRGWINLVEKLLESGTIDMCFYLLLAVFRTKGGSREEGG